MKLLTNVQYGISDAKYEQIFIKPIPAIELTPLDFFDEHIQKYSIQK